MLEAVQHFVRLPVPLGLLALLGIVLWFRDRETRRWVKRIAETVDKMGSEESGWCRHDPVSFVNSAEASKKLLDLLPTEKTPAK